MNLQRHYPRLNAMLKPLTFFLLVSLTATLPAHSAEPTPSFPAQLELSPTDETWSKLGDYRYIYRFFFKLYDVALYAPPQTTPEAIKSASAPFRLQFRYLREIEKSIILKSAQTMLERNLSDAQLQQIADRIDRINQGYETVKEGDRSALTFVPGSGTTLSINGNPVTTIEGDDFARLYFTIWFGEKPISESLKKAVFDSRKDQ